MSAVQYGNCYQSKSIAHFMHNQKIYEAGPQGVTFEHKGERYNVAAIAHEEEITEQVAAVTEIETVIFARVMSKSVAQFYEFREGHACTPKALKYEHPAIDALAQLAEAENPLAVIEGSPIEVPETVLDDQDSNCLYEEIFKREYALQGTSSIIPYQFFHHCLLNPINLKSTSEDNPPPPPPLSFLLPLLNRAELQNSPHRCVEILSEGNKLGTVAVETLSRTDHSSPVSQYLWLRVDTTAQKFILIAHFSNTSKKKLLKRSYFLVNTAKDSIYNITPGINLNWCNKEKMEKEFQLFSDFHTTVQPLMQPSCILKPVNITPYTSPPENNIVLSKLKHNQCPSKWFEPPPSKPSTSSDKPPTQPSLSPTSSASSTAPAAGKTTPTTGSGKVLTKVLVCVIACLGLTYLYRRFIQSRSPP
jgi:hypothetical protein